MISRFSPRWGVEISTLCPARKRQRFGQQLAAGQFFGGQDQLGRGAFVIELADKALQHLRQRQVAGVARKIGPVAPVLAGAEEEHLDAGMAAFAIGGEQIGFLEGGRD